MTRRSRKKSGFTLIELIVVIVLLGVLGSAAGLLIVKPIQAYSDIERRQRLVDQGELALRQITRDIRRALPNSIRPVDTGTGFAVEMINTVDGARYRDEIGGVYLTANEVLDFTIADTNFNLLGSLNTYPGVTTTATPILGQRIVIYNTVPTQIYLDAVNGSSPGTITPSTSALSVSLGNPGDNEYNININPAFQFSQQSPGQRLFLVDGPVSYICNTLTGQIFRYTNYNYLINQVTVPTTMTTGPVNATQSLLVSNVSACLINYNPGSSQRGGLVTLQITIQDSGESINLVHQVHVANVP
jgi:MSHA biogenesis protein MshO